MFEKIAKFFDKLTSPVRDVDEQISTYGNFVYSRAPRPPRVVRCHKCSTPATIIIGKEIVVCTVCGLTGDMQSGDGCNWRTADLREIIQATNIQTANQDASHVASEL